MKTILPRLSLSLLFCGASALSSVAADVIESADPSMPKHFSSQWQWNPSLNGIDIQSAWDAGYKGAGVVIGIVDEFVDWAHPDIGPNYDVSLSRDYVTTEETDPKKMYTSETHGTFVAGLAAGSGVGIYGAAPGAKLAGLHISWTESATVSAALKDFSGLNTTSLAFSKDPSVRIMNCSWGDADPNFSAEDTSFSAIIKNASLNNVIYVFSAGNDRGDEETTLCGQLAGDSLSGCSSIIYVGATGKDGKYATFSNFGSALFVTAPGEQVYSSGRGSWASGTSDDGSSDSNDSSSSSSSTTSVKEGYSAHSGTSFSTPIVSGVIALAAAENPLMDVRWAKHALARTSDLTSEMSGDDYDGWTTNSAGLHFSNDYGFGMVNPLAFVNYAKDIAYETVAGTINKSVTFSVGRDRSDRTVLVATKDVRVAEQEKIENIEVTLDLAEMDIIGLVGEDGEIKGGLTVKLKHGNTESVLLSPTAQKDVGTMNLNWTFVTNAFWGEDAAGTWTLTLEYRDPNYNAVADRDGKYYDEVKINPASIKFNTGTVALEDDVTGVVRNEVLGIRALVWDSGKTFTIAENGTLNVQEGIVMNAGTLAVNGIIDAYASALENKDGMKMYVNGGAVSVGDNGSISAARGISVNGGNFSVVGGGQVSGELTLNGGVVELKGTDSGAVVMGRVVVNGGNLYIHRTGNAAGLSNFNVAGVKMNGGNLEMGNAFVRGDISVNAGTANITEGEVNASGLSVGVNNYWSESREIKVVGVNEDREEIEQELVYDKQTALSTVGRLLISRGTTLTTENLAVTGENITTRVLTSSILTVGKGNSAKEVEVFSVGQETFEYRPQVLVAGTLDGNLTAVCADVYGQDGAKFTGEVSVNDKALLAFSGNIEATGGITTASTANLIFTDGLNLSAGNSTIVSAGTFDTGTATIKTRAGTAASFGGTYCYHVGKVLTVQAAARTASPEVELADNLKINMDISFGNDSLPKSEMQFIRVLDFNGVDLEDRINVGNDVEVLIDNAPLLYVSAEEGEIPLAYKVDPLSGKFVSQADVDVDPLRLTYSQYTPEQKGILAGIRTCLPGEANAGMSADLVLIFNGDGTDERPQMETVSEVVAALDQFLPVNLKTIASLHNKQAGALVGTIDRRSRELRAGAPVADIWARPLFSSCGFSWSVDPGLLASTSFRQLDLINYTTPYMVWANGGHSFSDGKNVKHTGESKTKLSNFSFGFDRSVTDTLSLGLFAGYLTGETELRNTGSTTESQVRNIGVYAAGATTDSIGTTYYTAMLSYGFAEYEMKRNTNIGDYSSTATADPDGSQAVAYISAGYEWDAGSHALSYQWTTGPNIALRYAYNSVDGYAEKGQGIDELKTDDFNYSSLLLTLGWRTTVRFDIPGFCTMVPELRVSYSHEFLDNGDIDTSFTHAPNAAFSTKINRGGQDYATAGFGATMMITEGFTVSLDYDCSFLREDEKPEHSFNVMARCRF